LKKERYAQENFQDYAGTIDWIPGPGEGAGGLAEYGSGTGFEHKVWFALWAGPDFGSNLENNHDD
jgi:hypothetical protein